MSEIRHGGLPASGYHVEKSERNRARQDSGASMTSSRVRIDIPHQEIANFCRRHHIRRLALFGSVLRDDFSPSSDIDVLVEFKSEKIPGFAFFGLQEELSNLLGRRADLRTPNELSKYFREEVLSEAEELYVETG